MSSVLRAVAVWTYATFLLTQIGTTDASAPSWHNLSTAEQTALAPLESDWESLPPYQRDRLVGLAHRFPGLTAEQQKRISARLLGWSRLTLEQRNLVRKRYQAFSRLRPEQRQAVRDDWSRKQASVQGKHPTPGVSLPRNQQ